MEVNPFPGYRLRATRVAATALGGHSIAGDAHGGHAPGPGGLDAVLDWGSERGDEPGPLLFRVRRGGTIVRERLTTQAIYHILRSRAKKAGVADFTPLDCRRTLAGDLLDRGIDISIVAKLLGHASTATTERHYADLAPDRLRSAVQQAFGAPEDSSGS